MAGEGEGAGAGGRGRDGWWCSGGGAEQAVREPEFVLGASDAAISRWRGDPRHLRQTLRAAGCGVYAQRHTLLGAELRLWPGHKERQRRAPQAEQRSAGGRGRGRAAAGQGSGARGWRAVSL